MDQARVVCLEMIGQRKYVIRDEDADDIVAEKPDGEYVRLFFLDGQFGAPVLKEYMSEMNKSDITHCIVVVGESITNPARAVVADLKGITFELFEVKELQSNITKHRLQAASYTRLSKDAASSFIKKYGRKIPRIKVGDPIARFFFFQVGDIIEVVRRNGYVTYRIVVASPFKVPPMTK